MKMWRWEVKVSGEGVEVRSKGVKGVEVRGRGAGSRYGVAG